LLNLQLPFLTYLSASTFSLKC